MAQKRAVQNDPATVQRPSRRRSVLVWPVLLLAAVAVGATLACREENRPKGSSEPAQPKTVDAPPATPEPAKTDVKSSFATLAGKWLRADGGYVVEVRRIETDGRLDAAYFNPSPIHVAQAKAEKDHGLIHVFLELRDRGYPGCTYNLIYDAGNDCLAGTYFQAAQGERYPVVFARVRP
jgi:hypothetical protein